MTSDLRLVPAAPDTARAVSYSQLVPGKTGISDLGPGGLYRRGSDRKLPCSRRWELLSRSPGSWWGRPSPRQRSFSSDSSRDGDGLVIQGDAGLGSGDAQILSARSRSPRSSSATMSPGSAQSRSTSSACKADGVAEGHLHDRLGNTAGIHGPGGLYLTGLAKPMEALPGVLQAFIGAVGAEADRRWWPAFLEFGGENFLEPSRGAMAKEISVGGTSLSRKVPDMESLPPMAAASRLQLGRPERPAGRQRACPSVRGQFPAFQRTPGGSDRPSCSPHRRPRAWPWR